MESFANRFISPLHGAPTQVYPSKFYLSFWASMPPTRTKASIKAEDVAPSSPIPHALQNDEATSSEVYAEETQPVQFAEEDRVVTRHVSSDPPKVAWDLCQRLLSPIPYNSISELLGTNISKTQPDVEVLAMTLKTIPTDKTSFHSMLKEEGGKGTGKEKDWMSIPLCVLAVGPPGFSSAPYTFSQKKGETPPKTLPLYDFCSKGNGTVFYPFDKGRTPRDRGPRMAEFKEMPIEFDTLNATAIIPPGFTMTKFLRDENDCFEPGKMFVNVNGPIAENSFVYLQMSVANIEQAANGRLLKIKKIMPLSSSFEIVDAALNHMCTSATDYDNVTATTKKQYPSISKIIYSGPQKIYRVIPDNHSFCVEMDDNYAQVVEGHETYQLPYNELLRATSSNYPSRARRILNVAIAQKAVTFLVRSNVQGGVIMDGQSQALLIVHIAIDLNKMLCLSQLYNLQDWPANMLWSDGVSAFADVDTNNQPFIVWTTTESKILDGDGDNAEYRRLLFKLSLTSQKVIVGSDDEVPSNDSKALLADHGNVSYYALDIRFCPHNNFKCVKEIFAASKLIISLHFRTQYKQVQIGESHKRKREALADDAYPDDMVVYKGK